MTGRQNIFLIGPMGSGKTAVGRQLARLLDRPFIDSDHEIEQRTGAPIALIFEREGEAGFRAREREVIAELTARSGIVLATGGGAVLDAANRDDLRARGWVVYLETSVGQQAERAGRTRHRPLLQGTDPVQRLAELMRVREPLYRGIADLVVPTDQRRVATVADQIAQRYQQAAPVSDALQTLTVQLGERSYPILIGPGLLESPTLLAGHIPPGDVLLVSNVVVAPLYAERLRRGLPGRRIIEAILPDGEAHKTLASANRLFDVLIANRFGRDAVIVALGGGVIGDLAGFAAACYQRGIDFVQVPTTLLADVDSSVGGKTAVNHPGGKNMIGAFHQPRAVLIDTELLRSLPARELRAGLAEVIKYGLIRDAGFFDWIESHLEAVLAGEPAALTHLIHRSCAIKAEIVSRDEREQGERALLNFGHTFGHAIEVATGYTEWLHGEAVGMGMVLAADLSHRLGMLPSAAVQRLVALLARAGLPVEAPRIGAERAFDYMRIDKKVKSGRVRLVLLRAIGSAYVTGDYPDAALQATLAQYFGAACALAP